MSEYSLQPNEVVLLRKEHVSQEAGRKIIQVDLILTNLHIVASQRGMFGGVKSTMLYPLDQVKVFRDQVQAIPEGQGRHDGTLRIYFYQGEACFRLQNRREAMLWAEKIDEAITGRPAAVNSTCSEALPGAETVANVIKDTVGVFKKSFGIGSKNSGSATDEPQQVAGACRSCGAAVATVRNQVATCSYCGTVQRIDG
ncbi:hypothetical protein [Actinomyces minihominis]|uniref:hypothetical protein n=1 Tax=Actinomyces minihominis TaxID=2002838 RepID=UPI000C08924F|nr:hypothetical protein [Actinomyces minihominis]